MNLEIFSDLICPWCFIGKRRLDEALATGVGEGVNVIWRAYQLYPGIPAEGMDRAEFLRQRYPGGSPAAARRDRIEGEARRIGIDMAFDRIERMPNTFLGHRLVHFAPRDAGVQHALAEASVRRLLRTRARRGFRSTCCSMRQRRVGMDRGDTAAYPRLGCKARIEVRREIERASMIGVTGVPCFVFAGAYALPGAQEPDVIAQVIERAKVKLAAVESA